LIADNDKRFGLFLASFLLMTQAQGLILVSVNAPLWVRDIAVGFWLTSIGFWLFRLVALIKGLLRN
jgi:hypothetical protein